MLERFARFDNEFLKIKKVLEGKNVFLGLDSFIIRFSGAFWRAWLVCGNCC